MFLTERVKVTNIQKRDLIRSRDIENNHDRYREVLRLIDPTVEYQFEISAGSFSVCSSPTHPMAVLRAGKEQYIETQEIKVGDTVITTNGYKKIDSVKRGKFYSEDFIDFTIDEDNNYYAGNSPDHLILAHNSATIYYPIWHLEVEDLLVLKNNKGTEDNRVRHMDYGVQFNKLMYERLITNSEITLFSPSDVPDLYETFFNDQEKFKELYETAERNTHLRKKVVKAVDLFSAFMEERKNTGRVYLMNVDHANDHGSFKKEIAPIRMSNLCCLDGDSLVDVIIDNKPQKIKIKDIENYLNSDIFALSKNVETGEIGYEKITFAGKTRTNAEVMRVKDSDSGKEIICTPDHLVCTLNRRYVRADELVETDILDIN